MGYVNSLEGTSFQFSPCFFPRFRLGIESVLAGEWASSELARPLSGFKGLSRQSQLFKNWRTLRGWTCFFLFFSRCNWIISKLSTTFSEENAPLHTRFFVCFSSYKQTPFDHWNGILLLLCFLGSCKHPEVSNLQRSNSIGVSCSDTTSGGKLEGLRPTQPTRRSHQRLQP